MQILEPIPIFLANDEIVALRYLILHTPGLKLTTTECCGENDCANTVLSNAILHFVLLDTQRTRGKNSFG